MPSPYTNGVPVTYFNTAPLGAGRFVADGEKWGGGIGTAVTLTYSFPGNSTAGNYAYFTNPYPTGGSGYGEWESWSRLSALEMQAVKTALDTWSHFANVTFVATTDNIANVGELRFAKSAQLEATQLRTPTFRSLMRPPAMSGSIRAISTMTVATCRSAPMISTRSCTRSVTRSD